MLIYRFIGLLAQAHADLSVYRFIGLLAQAGADLSVYRFIGLSAQAGKNRPCHHAACVQIYLDINIFTHIFIFLCTVFMFTPKLLGRFADCCDQFFFDWV